MKSLSYVCCMSLDFFFYLFQSLDLISNCFYVRSSKGFLRVHAGSFQKRSCSIRFLHQTTFARRTRNIVNFFLAWGTTCMGEVILAVWAWPSFPSSVGDFDSVFWNVLIAVAAVFSREVAYKFPVSAGNCFSESFDNNENSKSWRGAKALQERASLVCLW